MASDSNIIMITAFHESCILLINLGVQWMSVNVAYIQHYPIFRYLKQWDNISERDCEND